MFWKPVGLPYSPASFQTAVDAPYSYQVNVRGVVPTAHSTPSADVGRRAGRSLVIATRDWLLPVAYVAPAFVVTDKVPVVLLRYIYASYIVAVTWCVAVSAL